MQLFILTQQAEDGKMMIDRYIEVQLFILTLQAAEDGKMLLGRSCDRTAIGTLRFTCSY